jgi:oxygen-independent coproporphyrinogen-3 oxidase
MIQLFPQQKPVIPDRRYMTLSLYIHIPFCLSKCLYCDFASVPLAGDDLSSYVEGVCTEMALRRNSLEGPAAATLYLGGGTPSLLSPHLVERLLDAARSQYALSSDAEVTLEANPGTVDESRLAAYRRAGVNRLSLGLQSFDDQQLVFLGRVHTADEARSAFAAARRAGFDNIGVDLIHSLPGQSSHDWRQELEEAVALGPEHISAYALTLEEGTPLADAHERQEFSLLENDTAGSLYTLTAEVLTAAGYEQYEIANFARTGRRSRHNQAYWHWTPYLGFGAAAHSFSPIPHPGRRWQNPSDSADYLVMMEKKELPDTGITPLTEKEAMSEWLFLALRTTDGFLAEDFTATFGVPVFDVFDRAVPRLLQQGLLVTAGSRIRLSPNALPIANRIFLHFV